VLGRAFSIRDLQAVRARLDRSAPEAAELAESLAPAVTAGLLLREPAGAAADFRFTHEQVREFASAALTAPRRREIHAAIVDLLTTGGEPSAASLPLIARHAVAAGDTERAARFCVAAARAALDAHAPEEALRLVEQALPVASAPQDRVSLLESQDAALEMLRRPSDRLDGLAELAALAEASGDGHLELEVMLRRAAALRVSEETTAAANLARKVRRLAEERADRPAELAACLELAQALLNTTLGESYAPTARELDLDGAEETLRRAIDLAEQLGDEASLAAAIRELGTVTVGRLRQWFVDFMRGGRGHELTARIAGGETVEGVIGTLPIAPMFRDAMSQFGRALELYQKLDDRRGVMSTVIAMAFVSWAPEMHLASSARRIEEIRRLATRMKSLTRESERALADVQMLYGVQVFARAKVVPQLALTRGREAYEQARMLGERSIEFAAAGGLALTHLEMGEIDDAERWLGSAAAAARAAPTPFRARQLETWRGMVRGGAGDAGAMRGHLERALQMATDQGRPAGRCEALARLALEAARLGAVTRDEALMSLAEGCAGEAKQLASVLPGHPPWAPQADAALAEVHLAMGDDERACAAARAAVAALEASLHEDFHLEIVLPCAEVLLARGRDEERARVRSYLQLVVALVAQRTVDEGIRVRWFRGPLGRRLVRLAGPIEGEALRAPAIGREAAVAATLGSGDVELLRLLSDGRTNGEIAETLGMDEATVGRRLAELFGRIGAGSRAEATAFALHAV
jgi:tetratricopeptide (TPR) repeat protein